MLMGELQPRGFYDIAGDVLTESAEQLFAACRRPLYRVADWDGQVPEELHSAASIGFTASSLRGALVLALPENTLLALSPLSGPLKHELRQDWLSELANQMLGRVKNKLLAWNVDISLSISLTIRAAHLKLSLDDRQVVGTCLSDGHLRAYAWIDALARPELMLRLTGEEAQAEGELVLF